MSIRWREAIELAGPDNPRARNVLLVLAGFADDDGVCWPSVATIAQRVGIQPRMARRWLERLEADGWVVRTVRRGREPDGRSASNRYRIREDRFPKPVMDDLFKTGTGVPIKTGTPVSVNGYSRVAKSVLEYRQSVRKGQEPGGGDDALPVLVGVRGENPPPTACAKHPNGWHHDDPCHTCKRIREADEQRQRAADPRCEHGIPHGADLDAHGYSQGGCSNCEQRTDIAAPNPGTLCMECGKTENDCRARRRTNGHDYAPAGRTAAPTRPSSSATKTRGQVDPNWRTNLKKQQAAR